MSSFFKKCQWVFIIITLILVSSCASFYDVSVNGYAKEGQIILDKTNIFVYTNDDDVVDEELLRDFENKIKKAIINKGYIAADSNANAEFLLFFDYRVDSINFITPSENEYDLNISAGAFESVSTKNASPMFSRRLQLKLFDTADIPSTKTAKPIWVGDIISMGNRSDIRDIMDALIVAGIAHLGENTDSQKSFKISLKDKRIEVLNSGGAGS